VNSLTRDVVARCFHLEGPTPVMNLGWVFGVGRWNNAKDLGIDPHCRISKQVDGELSEVVLGC
jgi:hypothetical protein